MTLILLKTIFIATYAVVMFLFGGLFYRQDLRWVQENIDPTLVLVLLFSFLITFPLFNT